MESWLKMISRKLSQNLYHGRYWIYFHESNRVSKNLERKVYPYGWVYSCYTLPLRHKTKQMALLYVCIWGKVGKFEWLMSEIKKERKMKNEMELRGFEPMSARWVQYANH